MAIISESTGLPTNPERRFNSVDYAPSDNYIEWDSDYTGNGYVKVYKQAGVVVFDTGTINAGEFVGIYNARTYFTATGLDIQSLVLNIYKDGVLESSTTLASNPSVLTTGDSTYINFFPDSEYRITLSTHADAVDYTVSFFYFQLDHMPRGTVVGAMDYSFGTSGPALTVLDMGTATITGNGARSKLQAVTFNIEYDTTPSVSVSTGDATYNVGWDNVSSTGFNATASHVDNVGWSSTFTVSWTALGSVLTPFKPKITDYGVS